MSDNRNTGYRNTGDWNIVNRETGFFNTVQSDVVRVFNKECEVKKWEECDKPAFLYFDLTEWISQADMSDEEKEANPNFETTGGYLRSYEYKEAFQNSYNKASDEDKALLLKLPNFDAEVFKEISGIDVNKKDNSEEVKALKSELESIMKRIEELEK